MATKNLHFETLQVHVGQEQADPATDARRYPRISGFEPYRTHEPVENAPADRADPRKIHPFPPAADGSPLADSARTLCLHGPGAEMRRVRGFDLVPQICRRQ